MISKSSRLLAFDPGEITGIAFVLDGSLSWGMIAKPNAFENDLFIGGLVKMCYPTTILIEIPPTQGKIYNKEQSIVYSLLHRWFSLADYNVVDVSPGQWKGFVKKEALSITHIQDASGIARWFHRSIQNEQR